MNIGHPRKLKKTVKAWLDGCPVRPHGRRRLRRMFNRERRAAGWPPLPNRRLFLLDLP